jgi:hypothetical protein
MTTTEFSNEFDTLLNSYSTKEQFGKTIKALDEYEKSVFLTKAQEDIVIELYTGRGTSQTSFEETEEQRRYLQALVNITELVPESSNKIFGKNSYVCIIPEDALFITCESVLLDNKEVSVYPVSQDELSKIIKNPFRGPNSNRVLRLDSNNNTVELIYEGNNISKYIIRYIKKPSPIILIDLDNLSINGKSKESKCKLDSSLHRMILDRAVTLALQAMYSK